MALTPAQAQIAREVPDRSDFGRVIVADAPSPRCFVFVFCRVSCLGIYAVCVSELRVLRVAVCGCVWCVLRDRVYMPRLCVASDVRAVSYLTCLAAFVWIVRAF